MLDPDERQEWVHTARKLAHTAEILHAELAASSLPSGLAQAMVIEWWKSFFAPKLELPDFGNLFSRPGEE